MTREEIEARMAESARTVERIRSEWEAAAAAEDETAARLLAETFGGQVPLVPDVPTPGPPPHWQQAAEDKGDGE